MEVRKNYGYDDLPTRRNSTLLSPNNFEDAGTLEKSHEESGMELSYGTLNGGFHNKVYARPPYIKNTSNEVSTSMWIISIQNEDCVHWELQPVLMLLFMTNIHPKADKIQMSSWKYTTNLLILIAMIWLQTHKRPPVPMNFTLWMTSQALIPFFDSDSEDELHKQWEHSPAWLFIININLPSRSFFVWGILFRSFLFSNKTTI